MTAAGIVAVLGALAALVTAVAGLVTVLRRIGEVHTLVDGRLSDVLKRVTQLTAALETSDTDVPADPADPHDPGP